uniref:Uncharacterized protein n=1 Tax=Anguilla anguilla TaxID=7936 RepID=A0A0E9UPZ7_ANGAN
MFAAAGAGIFFTCVSHEKGRLFLFFYCLHLSFTPM